MAEPEVERYSFVVRVAIIGGLAITCWCGVIGAAIGLVRHFAG